MFTLIIYPNYPLLEGNRKDLLSVCLLYCDVACFLSKVTALTYVKLYIMMEIVIEWKIAKQYLICLIACAKELPFLQY